MQRIMPCLWFDGRAEEAVAALLDLSRSELDPTEREAELDRLQALIARAREEGR